MQAPDHYSIIKPMHDHFTQRDYALFSAPTSIRDNLKSWMSVHKMPDGVAIRDADPCLGPGHPRRIQKSHGCFNCQLCVWHLVSGESDFQSSQDCRLLPLTINWKIIRVSPRRSSFARHNWCGSYAAALVNGLQPLRIQRSSMDCWLCAMMVEISRHRLQTRGIYIWCRCVPRATAVRTDG